MEKITGCGGRVYSFHDDKLARAVSPTNRHLQYNCSQGKGRRRHILVASGGPRTLAGQGHIKSRTCRRCPRQSLLSCLSCRGPVLLTRKQKLAESRSRTMSVGRLFLQARTYGNARPSGAPKSHQPRGGMTFCNPERETRNLCCSNYPRVSTSRCGFELSAHPPLSRLEDTL